MGGRHVCCPYGCMPRACRTTTCIAHEAFVAFPCSQVSSTAGIAKGQWVRLFARSPSGRAARRALLAEPLATAMDTGLASQHAGADQAEAAAVRNGGNSTRRTVQRGFLPLPEAFVEGQQQVQELGLDRAEHLNITVGAAVQPAMAGGTLDAYLYGQNAVDSATSELAQLAG